ncbi:MAG: O-methyltransferase [Anaerolineae bacterium]|nr:O-methyltransferase [Anaerolineae bacterium]
MTHRDPILLSETAQRHVEAYIETVFVRERTEHAAISATTTENGLPQIDVRPQEGYFLMWLARAIGAQTIVEIGTLAGYSGAWLAQALPPQGKLITLELSAEHAAVAQRNFELLGLAERVEIHVGNAHQNLTQIAGPVDMVFIDAEKEGYDAYLDWALEHVRPGGVIAAHNALRQGQVADPANEDAGVAGMRRFNARLAQEPRLLPLLVPFGDGTVIGLVQG